MFVKLRSYQQQIAQLKQTILQEAQAKAQAAVQAQAQTLPQAQADPNSLTRTLSSTSEQVQMQQPLANNPMMTQNNGQGQMLANGQMVDQNGQVVQGQMQPQSQMAQQPQSMQPQVVAQQREPSAYDLQKEARGRSTIEQLCGWGRSGRDAAGPRGEGEVRLLWA